MKEYWSFSLALATGVYVGMIFLGNHLSDGAKDSLRLWLRGDYKSTWTAQFCEWFDSFFGKQHLSKECFLRSSVASLVSILFLYWLFGPVLGLLDRHEFSPSLHTALGLSVILNFVPDYLSLYETRWLMGRFQKVENLFGQFLLLLFDLVVSLFIICLFINIYVFIWKDGNFITPIRLIAIFSEYSIFFYSTFFTSTFAWLYFASSTLMKIFYKTPLVFLLKIDNDPVKAISVVCAGLILLTSFLTTQLSFPTADRGVSAIDNWFCNTFPSTCDEVVKFADDEGKRLEIFSIACIGGEYKVCNSTAFELYKIEPQRAVQLWETSCANGNGDGCTTLGILYHQELGVNRDYAKARDYYNQGCGFSSGASCTNLGMLYQQGFGVEKNIVQANKYYAWGCNLGNGGGCARLASLYRQGTGVEENFIEAHKYYTQGCNLGDGGSCSNLGYLYEQGLGIDRDYAQALEYYNRGCDLDNGQDCTNLGKFYRQGLGVDSDYAKARKYYARGCDLGNGNGCTNLGVLYRQGLGVKESFVQAHKYYTQGCDLGDGGGCTNLGSLYHQGLGVIQNYSQAHEYYTRACEFDSGTGCTNLGFLYQYGYGVDQDYAKAYKYYTQGCGLGNRRGCTSIKELYGID